MIYTCYEMIRDCRGGRPEGWSYFVTQYVPVVRGLLAHYFPERANGPQSVDKVLLALHRPDAGLFQSLDPSPERAFVAELRQHVLATIGADEKPPEVTIDLEALTRALEPLTVTEKLAVWFETMRYSAADTGRMLRMSSETAGKIRARAAELIRTTVDAWSTTLLGNNGMQLGREAAARSTKDCPPPKTFFDVIDGRATWRGREEMEQHVKGCWYCLDHYCRLLESVDVLRTSKPLANGDAEPYMRVLGIAPPKRSFWRR